MMICYTCISLNDQPLMIMMMQPILNLLPKTDLSLMSFGFWWYLQWAIQFKEHQDQIVIVHVKLPFYKNIPLPLGVISATRSSTVICSNPFCLTTSESNQNITSILAV